ncbi:hypothetical protein WMY93_004938 [Mugilogobius chulae]|uniref:Uncharacterized protein n=1 Tax=Mugilogobius chulae TaxID=88201 RepID=A0AAW0PQ51_9GOBI
MSDPGGGYDLPHHQLQRGTPGLLADNPRSDEALRIAGLCFTAALRAEDGTAQTDSGCFRDRGSTETLLLSLDPPSVLKRSFYPPSVLSPFFYPPSVLSPSFCP